MSHWAFFKKIIFRTKSLYQALSSKEKWTLLFLVMLGVFSVIKIYSKQPLTPAKTKPTGTLTEYIPNGSVGTINQSLARLYKSGLVRLDETGEIQPALAKSWEISENNKKYTFDLSTGVDGQEIIKELQDKDNGFANIDSKILEGNKLELTLKQPYAPLLRRLSQPIFVPGPYILSKKDNNALVYQANPNFPLGEPKIKTIIIRLTDNIDQAISTISSLQNHAVLTDKQLPGFNRFELTLNRRLVLFFNLEKPILQEKLLRQKLSKGKKLNNSVNLNLATINQTPLVEKAEQIKKDFKELNASINISQYSSDELFGAIIPAREYDLLLLGIDFGQDIDPYAMWHSSNISATGKNYSQYFNPEADKILEDARRSADEEKRFDLYKKFQKILDEDAPAIFFDKTKRYYIVSDRVRGIKINQGVTVSDRYNNVWQWWIANGNE